jgi:RimJ/RimL family protein N-acetyltransferase
LALEEQRIELVPLERQLLDALICGDRARARSLATFDLPKEFPAEAIELFLFRRNQLIANPNWQPWLLRAIVLQEGRRMAGYANFHGPPGVNDAGYPNAVSIGYTVFPEFRRRGIATRAAADLMNWARREHGVTFFVCGVRPDNAPSIRVLEKLGFARTQQTIEGETIFEMRLP